MAGFDEAAKAIVDGITANKRSINIVDFPEIHDPNLGTWKEECVIVAALWRAHWKPTVAEFLEWSYQNWHGHLEDRSIDNIEAEFIEFARKRSFDAIRGTKIPAGVWAHFVSRLELSGPGNRH